MAITVPNVNYTRESYSRIVTLMLRWKYNGPIDFDECFVCHDGIIRTCEDTINFYQVTPVCMPLDTHGNEENPIVIEDFDEFNPNQYPASFSDEVIDNVMVDELDMRRHGYGFIEPNFPNGLDDATLPLDLDEELTLDWGDDDIAGALLDLCDNDASVDLHREIMLEPIISSPSPEDDECSCIMEWDDADGQFICVNGGIQHECP